MIQLQYHFVLELCSYVNTEQNVQEKRKKANLLNFIKSKDRKNKKYMYNYTEYSLKPQLSKWACVSDIGQFPFKKYGQTSRLFEVQSQDCFMW